MDCFFKDNKVTLKTFKCWDVADAFQIETVTEKEKIYVVKVVCNLCNLHQNTILSQTSGAVRSNAQRYINGTNHVKKDSIFRHVLGATHQLAIQLENEKFEKNKEGANSVKESFSPVHTSHFNFGYSSMLNSSALGTDKFLVGQPGLMSNVFLNTPEKRKKENQAEIAHQQSNNKITNTPQPITQQSNIQQFNIQQVIKTESSYESDCSFSSVSASSPLSNKSKSLGRGKGRGSQVGQAINQVTPSKQSNSMAKLDESGALSSLNLEGFVASWEIENPHCRIVFMCRSCNKEMNYKLKGNWKAHFITHMDVKPFQCEICSLGFAQKIQLIKHMAKKHNIN